jgi:hypothetical protein
MSMISLAVLLFPFMSLLLVSDGCPAAACLAEGGRLMFCRPREDSALRRSNDFRSEFAKTGAVSRGAAMDSTV